MMILYRIRNTLLGSFLLIMAACNQSGTPVFPEDSLPQAATNRPAPNPPVAATQTEPESIEMDGTPMAPPLQASPPLGIDSLVDMAKEDLARRLAIPESQITLIEARAVVWPDSSLGCPQPGMRYLQVPEDGALILLQAQGSSYEYHNGGSRGLFLCEKVYRDPNPPPKIDLNDDLTPILREKTVPPPSTPDNSIPPGEDQ